MIDTLPKPKPGDANLKSKDEAIKWVEALTPSDLQDFVGSPAHNLRLSGLHRAPANRP